MRFWLGVTPLRMRLDARSCGMARCAEQVEIDQMALPRRERAHSARPCRPASATPNNRSGRAIDLETTESARNSFLLPSRTARPATDRQGRCERTTAPTGVQTRRLARRRSSAAKSSLHYRAEPGPSWSSGGLHARNGAAHRKRRQSASALDGATSGCTAPPGMHGDGTVAAHDRTLASSTAGDERRVGPRRRPASSLSETE